MSDVAIGIDVGTTSIKALAFDRQGRECASAAIGVGVTRPQPDRAEQDMDDVWGAVQTVIATVVRQCAGRSIVALGVTGQGDGAWLVGADGQPVRPAILWLDGRASAIADEWEQDERGQAIRRVCGSSVMAGALPELLAFMETEEPETLARARWNLNSKDWVRFKLTGVAATDASDGSETYVDPATGEYSAELLSILGQERYARLLPPVLGSTVGTPLLPEMAERLGLPVGVPVATGTMDTVAAAIGLGVVEPGLGYAIVGTTNFIGVVRDASAVPGPNVGVFGLGYKGRQIFEMAPMSGAPNFDWVKTITGASEIPWREFEKAALHCPPGAGGLTYMPYGALSGERAPFLDASSSSAFLGMSVATSSVQIVRAVYEGLAFSLRECAGAIGLDGEIRLAGGPSTTDLFPSILADVTGQPVICSATGENSAKGAAACGFAATTPGGLEAVLRQFAARDRVFEPNSDATDAYDQCFASFLEARESVRKTWRGSRALREIRVPESGGKRLCQK